MRIGRYQIKLGRCTWMQVYVPTRIWGFLFIWVLKKAHPLDVDRKPQFLLSTKMVYEGVTYKYYRAGESINIAWSCVEEGE